MKWIIFVLLIVVAILIFWGIFFKLAPRIVNEIPQSEISGLLGILVYGVIAFLGGLMIPLSIIIFAVISLSFWN